MTFAASRRVRRPAPAAAPSAVAAGRRPRGRGFTILELHVVVSIIAVLVSVLLPAMNMATAAAQSAVCQSNARQLATAALAAAHDNKRRLPASAPNNEYPHLLASYLNHNRDIWACPESDSELDLWNGAGNDWSVGYGFNFVGLNNVRLTNIRKPTATAMFVESQWGNNPYGACIAIPTAGVTGWSAGRPNYRHADARKATVAHVDGHVAQSEFDELEATATNEGGVPLPAGSIDGYLLWNRF